MTVVHWAMTEDSRGLAIEAEDMWEVTMVEEDGRGMTGMGKGVAVTKEGQETAAVRAAVTGEGQKAAVAEGGWEMEGEETAVVGRDREKEGEEKKGGEKKDGEKKGGDEEGKALKIRWEEFERLLNQPWVPSLLL